MARHYYNGLRKFLCESGHHSATVVRDEDGEYVCCSYCNKTLQETSNEYLDTAVQKIVSQ